jgi:nicotinamide-nucleotide amidase
MSIDLVTLATRVAEQLNRRSISLATAESCTGGWIATALTAIPGSSAWFERGFVTYSNESKHELLGVRQPTLRSHGAVSEEVAKEMARGALAHSRAQCAVAVTGIAGPDGGSADKPVGTVCFAWAGPGNDVKSVTRRFSGDREEVRRQSVVTALEGVIARLEERL